MLLVKLLKLPVQLILRPLPRKVRTFLSGVDVYLRFTRISRELDSLARDLGSPTVLDVGGGGGTLAEFLNPKFRITVADTDADSLQEAAKKGLHTVIASGERLPFKDNSFDFVVSIAAFQYVADKARFLAELKRVARRAVIIYTPVSSSLEIERKLHLFRQAIHFPDPWLEMELERGLPRLEWIKGKLRHCKEYGMQNQRAWYYTMILESIPVFNLFLPGIFYFLLFRRMDSKAPYFARVFIWQKAL